MFPHMNKPEYSLKEINIKLKNKKLSNSSAFKSGYDYGEALITMIKSLNMKEEDKKDFVRGLNRAIFKVIKIIDGQ